MDRQFKPARCFSAAGVLSLRLAIPASLALLSVMAPRVGCAASILTILPTYDPSITNDPNAASIQATIGTAISFYQSTFSTNTAAPIDVTIKFQEGGGLGSSDTTLFKISYQNFINALTADSSGDSTDATALANLPTGTTNPVNSTTFINVNTANLKALGVAGSFPPSSGFDGVITLNTALTTPGSPGSTLQYSLLAVVEHEIDEVLGLGSSLGQAGAFFTDPSPEDLYRYSATTSRSFATNACGSEPSAFFSLDGTTHLAQFNNCDNGADYGDWKSNPLPNGAVVKVQDAFATPGSSPTLTASSPESIALDALGYNLQSPTPEPSTLVLGGFALALTVVMGKRRAGLKKSL